MSDVFTSDHPTPIIHLPIWHWDVLPFEAVTTWVLNNTLSEFLTVSSQIARLIKSIIDRSPFEICENS
jgi:hypothetical protein